MQFNEVLAFKREGYFDGAVQADWFYDREKSSYVAGSYVFHGPKYFGVHNQDVNTSKHNIIDTVSFTQKIVEKLYEDKNSSRFILTIAGYGAGKSHLTVTLASLLSGHDKQQNQLILDNLCKVDDIQGSKIREYSERKNLVVVLNGMKNFNLDFEIIKSCRLALEQHGIGTEIIEQMTEAYNVALHFVNNTYNVFENQFHEYAKNTAYKIYTGEHLKDKLISSVNSDIEAFNIVNEVYKNVNGNYIRWDDGITGAGVLTKLCEELCFKHKLFDNICILFDEFGRYIEYTASNPAVAGDAALQQIFEAVQNSQGKMLFAGFIQSDLNAYMQRIQGNTNVIRYVGRYEASDKYYLSTNFETVLANLIIKKEKYETIVSHTLQSTYGWYSKKLYSSMMRWIGDGTKKTVWKKESLFNQTIINGCYPMHPITIWLLTNLSSWMQQRSTLTFVEKAINESTFEEINAGNLLETYKYPIEIIDSSIFEELYNAEEKGIQKSQHCLLYKEIISKYDDRLSKEDINILKAILVTNIAKFSVYNKEDLMVAIKFCTNMEEDIIINTVKNLEESLGIIEFDDNTNRFYFVAEAKGKNEFTRLLRNKSFMISIKTISEMLSSELMTELALNNQITTPFAQQHRISSLEWTYNKVFIDSSSFEENFIKKLIQKLDEIPDGDEARGRVITLYFKESNQSDIERVKLLIERFNLDKRPVIILAIVDNQNKMYSLLRERQALLSFSSSEREMFQKYFKAYLSNLNKNISKIFLELMENKKRITGDEVIEENNKLRMIALENLNDLFSKPIPFMFDGFEKKTKTAAIKTLAQICKKLIDKSINNKQSVEILTPEVKNRIKATLVVGSETSWQVLDDKYNFIKPMNHNLSEVYTEITASIPLEGSISGFKLLRKYMNEPYGLNIYSTVLLASYIIGAKHDQGIIITYYDGKPIASDQIISLLFEDKKATLLNLFKIEFGFMEKSAIEKLRSLLDEIKANQSVEDCDILANKLQQIKNDFIISEDLISDVKYCTELLRQGQELHQQIKKKLQNDIQTVAKVKRFINKKDDYEWALKLVITFNKPKNIAGSITYVYSEEYLQSYKELKKEIHDFLKDNIEQYIQVLDGDIRQIGFIEKKVEAVASALNKLGLIETENKATLAGGKLISEIEIKYKYQEVIKRIELDILRWKERKNIEWGELIENQSQIRQRNIELEQFIEDIQLREKYTIQLNSLLSEYDEEIEEIRTSVEEAISGIKNSYDLENALNLLSSVSKNNMKLVPDEFKSEILEIQSSVNQAQEIIQRANQSYTISQINSYISNLSNNIDSYIDHLLKVEMEKILRCKVENQKQWLVQNIKDNKEVEQMKAKQCLEYIEKLNSYPGYFTQEAEEQIKQVIGMVQERIKVCKVDGVVTMFNELSYVEKQFCLEELKRIFG